MTRRVSEGGTDRFFSFEAEVEESMAGMVIVVGRERAVASATMAG